MKPNHAPWTDADNQRIRELVEKGVSALRAAAILKRSTISVRNQARKFGCPFPSVREARKKLADDAQRAVANALL